MIGFTCCGCGADLRIGDEWSGKLGRCPHCRATTRLPGSITRYPRWKIVARFCSWPVILLGFWTFFLGWPLFLGGAIALAFFLLFAWAFTNVGTWLWCKMDGSSHHLKAFKAGGGDPFWESLPPMLNPDPDHVKLQGLYRLKQQQEIEEVNRQFGLPPDFMTGSSASSQAPVDHTKRIDDPDLI
jgi:hypothetical protein